LRNHAYVFGGFGRDGKIVKENYQYSLATCAWTKIASLIKVNGSCAACNHLRRIYVVGDGSRYIELYNPYNGIVKTVKYSLPTRKFYGPQVLSCCDELYIFFNKKVGKLTDTGFHHVTMI
jgi:hypothetical protein